MYIFLFPRGISFIRYFFLRMPFDNSMSVSVCVLCVLIPGAEIFFKRIFIGILNFMAQAINKLIDMFTLIEIICPLHF